MKKSKKLAILGLSAATAAVAATGAVSSFAWFATNNTVTASGMTIKVSSNDIYLQIKKGTDAWDKKSTFASASAKVDEAKVSPVAAVNSVTDDTISAYTGGAVKWANTSSDDVDKADKGGKMKYKDVSSTADPSTEADKETAYTLKNTFTLRLRPSYKADGSLADEADQPKSGALTASVEWANSSDIDFTKDKIAYAVSVLVYTGTTGELFKVNSTSNVFERTTDTSSVNLAESMIAGEDANDVTCKVFVFIDGENENCKTSNVLLDSSYSIKVNFTVANA